jgi:signal transduction histidine kinase
VTIDRRTLAMQIRSDAAAAPADTGTGADPHSLEAIEQRVASLGGEFNHAYLPAGGTSITARFTLESTVLPG